MFQRTILPPYSGRRVTYISWKLEAGSSESLVPHYQTTWCHITENYNLHVHCCKNLKSHCCKALRNEERSIAKSLLMGESKYAEKYNIIEHEIISSHTELIDIVKQSLSIYFRFLFTVQ